MIVTLDKRFHSRIRSWSKATKQSPNILINKALEQSLDDWEDYTDAINICSLVDNGSMKTYSFDEVERQLNELNSMEH